jgi:peptide/nickel transport system permease protein
MKHSWSKRLAWSWLLFCGTLALFGGLIAHERPLWLRFEGESYFPASQSLWDGPDAPLDNPILEKMRLENRWHELPQGDVWRAPIPFSAGKFWQDSPGALLPPGSTHPNRPSRYIHWLGTDGMGRDVAAAFVNGAHVALLTGLWASALAILLGLLVGSIAGYFGDNRLYVARYAPVFGLLALPFAYFYGFVARQGQASAGVLWWATGLCIFAAVCVIFAYLGRAFAWKIHFLQKKVRVPADMLLMRFAEIVNAIPRLMLVVAVAALWQDKGNAFYGIITIIGLFGWTGVARYARAELLTVRESNYVTAARGLGLSNWTILRRHALPNILGPIKVAAILGIGASIMLEAGISFLGYGDASMDGATWGSLLNGYRSNTQAWWLLAVPFSGICLTMLALEEVSA